MPNPRKPTHLKSISGTQQPCRDAPASIELPLLERMPDPPDWLPNSHAVKEWNRVAPILIANRLLAEADLSTLGHMCALHGKIVQLWHAGEAPTGHLMAQFISIASAFGLSTVWRGKVKPVGEKEKSNRFSNNGKRPA